MKKFIVFIFTAIIIAVSAISCDTAEKRAERGRILLENARNEHIRDSIRQETERIAKERERRADSIRVAKHFEDVQNSIVLTSYRLSSANYVGGRDISFHFKNINKEKTIKYLDFSVTFYNAVGDKAYDEIRSYATFNGRITGPIKPNGSNYNSYFFECAIYNYQAKTMVLNSISIEYMDGSTLYITGDELKLIKGYKG